MTIRNLLENSAKGILKGGTELLSSVNQVMEEAVEESVDKSVPESKQVPESTELVPSETEPVEPEQKILDSTVQDVVLTSASKILLQESTIEDEAKSLTKEVVKEGVEELASKHQTVAKALSIFNQIEAGKSTIEEIRAQFYKAMEISKFIEIDVILGIITILLIIIRIIKG